MNQSKHLFQFTAKQIADACAAEVAYREARVAYWRAEQGEQIKRASTLTAVVKTREWEHTSGKGYEVYADIVEVQDINLRLRMAADKIFGHLKAIEEYRLKGGAYASQAGNRTYELDPDDVAYFRLNGAPRGE